VTDRTTILVPASIVRVVRGALQIALCAALVFAPTVFGNLHRFGSFELLFVACLLAGVWVVSSLVGVPLTYPRAWANLLLWGFAGEFPERSRGFLERAERRARELALLTQDLLTLSRAREGRAAVEPIEVRPDELVAATVAAMQDAASRAGVVVVTDLASGLATLEGDAAGLHQLLGNLVSNAVRYTPRGGTVTVRVRQSDAKLVIEVADTGIGIAPEDLPRVFEEFYRSANARAHTGDGTGLGLSIVKAVAEQHGGVVSVESTVGQGTRVTVELPVKEEGKG
jgi:signal transduction histidine kinase